VDLFLAGDYPAAPQNGVAVVTLTVGNAGSPTTSDVHLTYATPAHVNIDRSRPLPAGCAFVYTNLDHTVPEVILCRIPGLGTGQTRTFQVSLRVSAVAPPVQTYAMAMVLPAQGSADVERYITDNIITTGVNISSDALPPPGRTNLFMSADHPVIGAAGAEFTYIVGNNGPDATTAPVTLTVTVTSPRLQ